MPDLPENRATVVSVDDRCIMLCRTARGIRAADGFCPHQRKTLADARVRGGAITCLHHGARFDLDTGKSLSSLTPNPLVLFPAEEVDGALQIVIAE
jgi:3-phenylpropionate/trans-cinnamate dioxygenase ferredoxin component